MKFLENFKSTVFQTFKDHPGAGGYAKIFPEEDEAEFKKLNTSGCGIYFTPNGFKGGRKMENLVSINAAFADLDICKEGDNICPAEKNNRRDRIIKALLSDRIAPNFILNTKNGVQPIWLLEGAKNDAETRQNWTWLIKGIIEWSKEHGCAGDEVKDLTRVIRLPGYFHMKGGPYMVTVDEYSKETYPIWFMREAFPYEPPKPKEVEKPKYKKGDVANEIDRLDFQELVIRAFASVGRPASFDNQKRLILDGRLTGTHQGKTGDGDFLASSSHEPFQGNRITVVSDILGVTNKEAYRWIKEEYDLDKTVAKSKVLKIVEDSSVKQKKRSSYYTWGTKNLTESFAPIKSETYAVIGAGYGVGKTTYCIDVAIKNANLGHKVLYLSLEMSADELYDQLGRGAAGITIPEEIYDNIPSSKKTKYDNKVNDLRSMENLVIKGVRGGTEVTWDCLVEMMSGDWDMIFVDNFNLVAKEQGVSQYDHEGSLSNKFLSYTMTNQVPIMVVHHYSKGGARENVKTGYSLSGNAKIMNDAQRIILLERKTFDIDENPTDKEKAVLKVTLDKGRGYGGNVNRIIYFNKGVFFDEFSSAPIDHWSDK